MIEEPFAVQETVRIPVQEGGHIAARLWIPNDVGAGVAAIFEFHPYRRRDFMRGLDDYVGRSLAGAGFAYVRGDIPGTGDSPGRLEGEYREAELMAALHAIDWIAQQPWCSGAVGMRGISWGGFNSLLLSARRNPALRAIVAHCASDNMYTDDAHYVGGCLSHINFIWGVQYPIRAYSPPDPDVVTGWREQWLERLEGVSPIMTEWLAHQRLDAYWQQGSADKSIDEISCPVYQVGGTCDGYRNAIPRLHSRLKVPAKALIGPWSHTYPDFADPGPAIGFINEEVRWWDRWLRGRDTGVMESAPLHLYIVDGVVADTYPAPTRGRWSAERRFLSPETGGEIRRLRNGRMQSAWYGRGEGWRRIGNGKLVGLSNRYWFPYPAALAAELPGDQSSDDRNSTCYESAAFEHDVELVGVPLLRAVVRADQPVAMIAARLNVVRPDGTSWLLSYGVLNLCHRDGPRSPNSVPRGEAVPIEIALYLAAHRVRTGERLRLALSDQLWPLVWSPPRPASVEILEGASEIWLPLRAAGDAAAGLPFSAQVDTGPATYQILAPPQISVAVQGPDSLGGVAISERKIRAVRRVIATDTIVSSDEHWQLSMTDGEPNSSRWSGHATLAIGRGSWQTTLRADVELSSTETHFRIDEKLTAMEGGDSVAQKTWSSKIERDLL